MKKNLKVSRLNIAYEDVLKRTELSSSTVIMVHHHSILLGWNTWRKQWELPSGHIEDGELPNQTAIREVDEEVHYVLEEIKYIDSFSVKSSAENSAHIRVIFYTNITEVQQDEFNYDPNMNENDKLVWLSVEDISKSDKIDYADSLILKSLKNWFS
ncbi:MAG: NUDIX hydrolase [Liquorilactobacillus satsumensis]